MPAVEYVLVCPSNSGQERSNEHTEANEPARPAGGVIARAIYEAISEFRHRIAA